MLVVDARTLRHEFDAAFAQPSRDVADDSDDLLAVLVGQSHYALRVAELGGVAAGRRVTRVPSADAALLGLVGVRGNAVPVYDLARLVDEPPSVEPPRWLALSPGNEPIALAFRALEGHLRLPRAAFETAGRGNVAFVVRVELGVRPVVDVPSVVRAVRARSNALFSGKELRHG